MIYELINGCDMLYRNYLQDIQTELSPTDMKQKWGATREMYAPTSLKNFCCHKNNLYIEKIASLVAECDMKEIKAAVKSLLLEGIT